MTFGRVLRPARRIAGWLVLAALAVAGWSIQSGHTAGAEQNSINADLGHNPTFPP